MAKGQSLEPSAAETASLSVIASTYQRLRRDIIDGRYQAGEKLRVEHLKLTYDVSAGTLREALVLLLSDSLVVASEQRGFRVAPMSLTDAADLTRSRILLESEALRESIEVGDDEWEATIVSAYHKLSLVEARLRKDAANAFNEWELRNREYHDALVSGCSSRWILQLRSLLYQQAERYRRLSATKGPPPTTIHEEHRQLFQAALKRDTDQALRALKAHINHALTVIRSSGLLPPEKAAVPGAPARRVTSARRSTSAR